MNEFARFLANEWSTLSAAPATFMLFFVLACIVAFVGVRWGYTRVVENKDVQIATLKERLEHKEEQLTEYRGRLHLGPSSDTAFSRYTNARLKSLALEVVGKIRHLADEGRRYEPPWWEVRGWDSMTEEERNRAFRENTNKQVQRSQDNIARYEREMKIDAILLRDEIEVRLPKTSTEERHDRFLYEHPTNPLGLGSVADDLEKLAKALPEKDRVLL